MSALVIKNLPEALHARLKLRAKANHRSLTKEALALLEAGVMATPAGNAKRDAADPLEAVFSAGDDLVRQGGDPEEWARNSRQVWR